MQTMTRRQTFTTAAAIATAGIAHTLIVPPVAAAAPAPAALNTSLVETVAGSIGALTDLVRTTHAEASAIDPEIDALIARAAADLDAGVRRLQEAVTLARG